MPVITIFVAGLVSMLTPLSRKEVNRQPYYIKDAEITFQCPACFAMETLSFEEGKLVNTRRWTQSEGNIYHHNCGRPAQPFSSSKAWMLSGDDGHLLSKGTRSMESK